MSWLYLLALTSTALYLLNAQRHREFALATTEHHCKQMDVQLLDQTVSLKRLWFKLNNKNQPALWRRYDFEFTATGEDRNRGYIVTLGNHVETVQFEPHKFY